MDGRDALLVIWFQSRYPQAQTCRHCLGAQKWLREGCLAELPGTRYSPFPSRGRFIHLFVDSFSHVNIYCYMNRTVGDTKINKMWSLPLQTMKDHDQSQCCGLNPREVEWGERYGAQSGKLWRMTLRNRDIRRPAELCHQGINGWWEQRKGYTRDKYKLGRTWWLTGWEQRKCQSYWDDIKSASGDLCPTELSLMMEMFYLHCSVW